MGKVATLFKKFLTKGGFFLFLRSQLSSQMATIADNTIAILLKKTLDILKIKVIYLFYGSITSYVLATIVGQICGGAVSCFLNYKWAFKDLKIKLQYVIIKFLLIWIGSLSLNTFFTFLITEWLKNTKIATSIFGIYNSDDVFIFVKLFVAIIIGVVWNFLMYKYFVFKDIKYKNIRSRSEERRGGKECRSRWSPYH